jgi:hypothetical protein
MHDADNHLVECQYIRAHDLTILRQSNDHSALKGMCFHNLRNAFDNVSFGANVYGIHRATMSEVLHAIQKGWYIYTLSALYKILSGRPLEFLDSLAMRISHQCRHQSDRDFPRLTFPNGIRSYKLLHAHEMSGLLLLISISLYCKLGFDKNHKGEITKNSFVRNPNCAGQLSHLKKFRELLQMLLCMEAWMKEDSIERDVVSRDGDEQSQAKVALRTAIKNYVQVVRRKKGHGLKLVKTHSVLHVPDDMLQFGSPNNWNSSRMESGHKVHAKAPARLTQRRKDRLEDQVCSQTTNILALSMAKDLIANSPDYSDPVMHRFVTNTSPSQKVQPGGSRFVIKVSQSGRSCVPEWIDHGKQKSKKLSKTGTACTLLFGNHVYDHQIRFVANTFYKAAEDFSDAANSVVPNFDIRCFTEIKVVENGISTIYRGHPSFRGEDPWHDWVNVKWIGRNRRTTKVPAEIQFFVNVTEEIFPPARYLLGYRGEGTYAVIHSMLEEPTPHSDSLLLSRGVREKENNTGRDVFHLQRVDSSFVGPAFVVDNIGCPRQSLLVLTPRSEWSNLFI